MYTTPIVFTNGTTGQLVYPDLYDRLMVAGDLPDADLLAVLDLLRGEGSLPKSDYISRVQSEIKHYQRLYRLAALCLETPRLILARRTCAGCGAAWDGDLKTCASCMESNAQLVQERNAGEIGPRDLTIADLLAIQQDFFWSAAAQIGPAPAPNPGGPARALPLGDDVWPEPEPAAPD